MKANFDAKTSEGLPKINLGTIPAAGGTQRLVKSVGKSKAMEIVLSGTTISAAEALNYGLVSKVVSIKDLERETTNLAENIASKSLPVLILAKEAILRSFESTLSEGMINERRLFQSTFELEDRKEGMEAFLEKRLPKFNSSEPMKKSPSVLPSCPLKEIMTLGEITCITFLFIRITG